MITDWPSAVFIRSVMTRASVSDGPPAGYGTIMVIARDGYVSAFTPQTTSAVWNNTKPAMRTIIRRATRMASSRGLCPALNGRWRLPNDPIWYKINSTTGAKPGRFGSQGGTLDDPEKGSILYGCRVRHCGEGGKRA